MKIEMFLQMNSNIFETWEETEGWGLIAEVSNRRGGGNDNCKCVTEDLQLM